MRSAARRRRSWPRGATTRWRSSATRTACTRTCRRTWTTLPNRRNCCRIKSLTRATGASRRAPRRSATTIDWLQERHDWPGLSAIGKVVAERRLSDGTESVDTRYYLLSAEFSAERFGRVVRAHWAIENADAPHRTPALGARHDAGRGPGAQPQGQRRRLPRGRPPAGSEHRPDASRQAFRPPQAPPRPAQRRLQARTAPRVVRKHE